MFNCPVCKVSLEVGSRLDVGRHLRVHIRTLDYPLSFPLKCQHGCHSPYSSLDAFVKHKDKKHSLQYSNIAPVANDSECFDDDILDRDSELGHHYLQMNEGSIEDESAKCYSDEALKLVLCLVSKSSATFNCASELLEIFDSYMQSTLDNIHNKLLKFPNCEQNPAMSVVLEEIHKSKQSLHSLNTEYTIKKSISETRCLSAQKRLC